MYKAIRQYLNQNGIKYSNLAKRTNIPAYKIYKILEGKKELNLMEYKDITKALGVPFDYFLGDEEQNAPLPEILPDGRQQMKICEVEK